MTTTKSRPTATKTLSKQDQVIRRLKRRNGVTQTEIAKLTGWQVHTIRGFISGICKKRLKLNVTSEPDKKGVRRYRIVVNTAAEQPPAPKQGKTQKHEQLSADCLALEATTSRTLEV